MPSFEGGMETFQMQKLLSFENDPQAAMASYSEFGYHLEPNVWSDEEITEMNMAAETFPSFREGRFAPEMKVHLTYPAFHRAIRNPKIVWIMERLLSGKVSAIQSEFFFCPAGTRGFSMHQDNSYVQARPDAFGSAWSALQDVGPENGGLVLYPGTHREDILPVEACPNHAPQDCQDPNANSIQVVLPEKYQGVDVHVPKGGVVFLHAHVVHSSRDNRSDGFRKALLMTYIRRGEPFRPGNTAKRTAIDVYD